MNSLSWLIYFANLLAQLNVVSAIITACGGIIILGLAIAYQSFKPLTKWIAIWFVFLLLALVTPSEKTVMLIIASEIGERVVNSERVQGVIDPSIKILQDWANEKSK